MDKRSSKRKQHGQLVPPDYWFDHLGSVLRDFLIKVRVYELEDSIKIANLGSLGPHQTPTPATEPT